MPQPLYNNRNLGKFSVINGFFRYVQETNVTHCKGVNCPLITSNLHVSRPRFVQVYPQVEATLSSETSRTRKFVKNMDKVPDMNIKQVKAFVVTPE